jgi:phosphate starvation-inducible protein PhoH and related proteins
MKEPKRIYKQEIKYGIALNEEQKDAKRLILDNQIVIITGPAGSGKTTVNAQCSLDFLNKGQCDRIFITRPFVEVGRSLGYLPGDINSKSDPYFEAFLECVQKCSNDKVKYEKYLEDGKFKYLPIQYIRGRTIDDYLFLDEAQSTSPHEMEAIMTRLGKTGKLVICGDLAQKDISMEYDGLQFALDICKKVDKIKHIKLHSNHRSELVQEILEAKKQLKR